MLYKTGFASTEKGRIVVVVLSTSPLNLLSLSLFVCFCVSGGRSGRAVGDISVEGGGSERAA